MRVHRSLYRHKTKKRLREHLLRRVATQHLVDVAHGLLAGRRGLRRTAVLNVLAERLGRPHVLAPCKHLVVYHQQLKRVSVGSKVRA